MSPLIPSVEAVVAGVRLSTMPAVAARLVDAAAREDIDPGQVAEIVGLDHALTSVVLRAACAADFSACGSVPEAVDRLGVATVTSLALGSMLAERLDAHGAVINEIIFRRWSIHVAVAARAVARNTGAWDPDEAYAAGLLQDVGVLALAQHIGDSYIRLLGSSVDTHHGLPSIERERLNLDHGCVGAETARKWRLPESTIVAIEHHHDASDAPSNHAKACQVLDLAGTLASALLNRSPEAAMQSFRSRADAWFALGAADTEDLVRRVSDEACDLLAQLRIDSGEAPDVERLLLRAEEQWVRQQARLGRRNRELERRNRDLVKRTECDTLTGVGTRGLLERELPLCTDRCARERKPLAVTFIDVDGLKPVNDRLGHAVGDDVLRRLAASIQAAAGEDAIVCRFGGDEFVVIMPGRDIAGAAMVAQRMLAGAMQAGRRGSSDKISVTLSIGCASLPSDQLHGRAAHRLVGMADEAMYIAKRSGGNRVELASASIHSIDRAA